MVGRGSAGVIDNSGGTADLLETLRRNNDPVEQAGLAIGYWLYMKYPCAGCSGGEEASACSC